MKNLLTIFLLTCVLAGSGCAVFGRRDRDWYDGPEEYREDVKNAIDAAIHNLSPVVGRQLKWDWNRNRIEVRMVQPDGVSQGHPYFRRTVGGHTIVAYGRAIPGQIMLPYGFGRGTLRHEVAHVVLFANGISDVDYHHTLEYFKRNTRGNVWSR